MSIYEKIKPILPILFILLIGIDLFFPSIEPLYTITNGDQYPHNVTIKVTEDAGGFYDERFYQLDPGESATVEKPIGLVLEWMNPFKEGELFYAPGGYEYYVESEERKGFFSIEPSLSTSFDFRLVNGSEGFDIDFTTHH